MNPSIPNKNLLWIGDQLPRKHKMYTATNTTLTAINDKSDIMSLVNDYT